MALRTVGVRLMAEVSGYVGGMRTAGVATRDFTTQLDRAARAGQLDAVADSAGRMGLGLAGGFAAAIAAAAQFDKQMSAVSAATHASAADLQSLREAAMQAGKDTAFSATQAAAGIEELAKAGVSTANILQGGLKGALDLAAAGGLEVAEAAEVAASAMTQFKLRGSEVPHVADLLAAAAGKAQGSVHDMSMALNQAGLVSAQMGLSIEDTTGTLAAFASTGLMGSDAGTSLKTALLMLANPTDKAAELMQDLGIQVYDVTGRFVGIKDLAGQLQVRLGGLTQEQRNAALATIFGADAIRAASILYEQGAQGIQGWIEKVDDSGYAAETARIKTDNLVGDLERLRGELENLAIQSGGGANEGLRFLTQTAEALVAEFGSLPPVVGSTVTVLAGMSGAALLLAAGWLRVRRTTADALTELSNVGPTGARAARGLEAVSRWGGRAVGVLAALQIASAAFRAATDDLNPQVDALGRGLARWGQSGQLAGEAARVLGKDMADLGVGLKFLADTDNSRRQVARWGQDLLETVVPGLDTTNTSLARTRERVTAMDQALAGLVQSGQADAATAAFQRLADQAARDGVSIDELRKLFPGYTAALEVAGGASATAAGQVGQVGQEAAVAAEQVDKLKEKFDELFDRFLGLDRANLKVKEGMASLREELTSGARSLDENTEAGRANAGAVLDQVERIKALRDARLAHGATLDEANGKYATDIEGLRKTLLQLGYNAGAVDALVGKYESLPGQVSTNVSAPGVTAATGQVQDFNFAVKNVPPSKRVPFWASTAEATAAVNALKYKIDSLKGKHVAITGTVYWTSRGDLKVPGGTLLKDRWGGVHEGYTKAATGVVREARMFDTRSPGHYLVAEPETGGEAFVPRFGDYRRSMSILDRAASWYGATVRPVQAPRYVPAATQSTVVHHVVIQWPDGRVAGEIVAAGLVDGRGMTGFRRAVADQGGSVRGLGL